METTDTLFSEAPNNKLLKATEVAQILDVSRALAYRLMQQGEIRTVRIAGSSRVRAVDLEKYISENLYSPSPQVKGMICIGWSRFLGSVRANTWNLTHRILRAISPTNYPRKR